MTSTTPNYDLILYDSVADAGENFIDFRTNLAGTSSSNMTAIDTAVAGVQTQVTALQAIPKLIPLAASGSANSYTATTTSLTSVVIPDKTMISLKINVTNTASSSLNIQVSTGDWTGAKSLQKVNTSGSYTNVASGDLRIGKDYIFRYDTSASVWVLIAASNGDQIYVSGTANNFTSIGSGNTLEDSGILKTSVALNSQLTADNLLINGGFRFFQRQVPGTPTSRADNTYGPDCWYALTQSNAINISRGSANTDTVAPYHVVLSQANASAQRMGIAQIVESANSIPMRGQGVNFQARIYCDISQPVRIAILEWTGAADSVTSDVVNNWTSSTYTIGNFFSGTTMTLVGTATVTPSSTTWTTINVGGTVSTSCNNLIAFIWTANTTAQNTVLYVGQADMHIGNFTRTWHPRPISQEYSLCQKYYPTEWEIVSETWTYASANTFTVPGDLTSVYRAGTKLRWNQTTTKYGRVATSSYSSPNTTVAITGDSISNATIDENYISYSENPLGFVLPRERLTANRTYYVRTNGSDSNTGLEDTSSGAFLTIQKAIDTIATSVDANGYTITVQVANGTYTSAVNLRNVVGSPVAGQLILQGNVSTPASCIISTTSSSAISAYGIFAVWTVQGFKVQTSGSGSGVAAINGSRITLGAMEFGACATYHIQCEYNSAVQLTASYTISGNSTRHLSSICGGLIHAYNITITLSGTRAFTCFAYSGLMGNMYLSVVTVTGTATGTKYYVEYNSVIFTGGLTLPGNVAGGTSAGGQYL